MSWKEDVLQVKLLMPVGVRVNNEVWQMATRAMLTKVAELGKHIEVSSVTYKVKNGEAIFSAKMRVFDGNP